MSLRLRLWLALALPLGGCGDDAPPPGDAAVDCPVACNDGVYCNGLERCDPRSATADENGCIPGTPPCPGTECDEASDLCEGDDCPDLDGDGQTDVRCGGVDCDDSNPDRFVGAIEVCDTRGVDEDCDPTTLGDDADGDGYVDDGCCNALPGGAMRCGNDCNDRSSEINPEVVDVCGNGDEDCDGDIDEDPNQTFYRDADGDGFGVSEDTILACAAMGGYVLRDSDCDDDRAGVNPDESERCDTLELDENCNGERNEGCSCGTSDPPRQCGTSEVGECSFGVQECISSAWSACVDAVDPISERCNGLDDDCDTRIDEDFECRPGESEIGTNMCGRMGERTCLGDVCRWATADFSTEETSGTCDYCDDTGRGPDQEIAIASGSLDVELVPTAVELLGSAREGTGGTLVLTSVLDSSPRVGGVFLSGPVSAGYGGVKLEVFDMRSNQSANGDPAGDGWAIVMVVDQGADPLGGGGFNLGVPRDHDGFAAEWRRYQATDPSDERDSLVLRALEASGVDPVLASSNPRPDHYAESGNTPGRMEMIVQPDLPGSTTDETSVTLRYFWSGSYVDAGACGGTSGTPCDVTIPAGTELRVGLTAAVGAGRDESFFIGGDQVGLEPPPRMTVSGICP